MRPEGAVEALLHHAQVTCESGVRRSGCANGIKIFIYIVLLFLLFCLCLVIISFSDSVKHVNLGAGRAIGRPLASGCENF